MCYITLLDSDSEYSEKRRKSKQKKTVNFVIAVSVVELRAKKGVPVKSQAYHVTLNNLTHNHDSSEGLLSDTNPLNVLKLLLLR